MKINRKIVEELIAIDPKDIIIPEGYTSIGNYAFFDLEIESITIPNTVTSIGDRAFWKCKQLKSISIPDSVTEVGHNAFSGCIRLLSAKLSKSLTKIEAHLFKGCIKLESIDIPFGITHISKGAFSGCTELASVTLPESITDIEDLAFSNCKALASIVIPDSVSLLALDALAYSNLTSITIGNAINCLVDCPPRYIPLPLTSLTISDHVDDLEPNALSNITTLESISVPSHLDLSNAGLENPVQITRRALTIIALTSRRIPPYPINSMLLLYQHLPLQIMLIARRIRYASQSILPNLPDEMWCEVLKWTRRDIASTTGIDSTFLTPNPLAIEAYTNLQVMDGNIPDHTETDTVTIHSTLL